jgi:hypothetical protein
MCVLVKYGLMALSVSRNERAPWSKITNTEILRPGDELRLLGVGFMATLGVLDAHNPRAEQGRRTLGQLLGIARPQLPNHHHVLVQIKGSPEVLATGLWVGVGDPDELLFGHVSRRHFDDEAYGTRLTRLHTVLHSGNHGLYYVSDQERLSATPEGQTYVNPDGSLIID